MRLFEIRNVVAIGLIVAMATGCGDSAAPQLSLRGSSDENSKLPEHGNPSEGVGSVGAAMDSAPATNAKGQPKETWEAVFAYGTKIGWGQQVTTNFVEDGQKLVRVDNRNHVAVDREGQRTTIDIATRSVETPGGELLRFETEMNAGASKMITKGRVEQGSLHIETTTSGKTMHETLPWLPGTLGFNAAEQSLARSPLQPGEKRSLKALMPVTNEIVTIDLVAGGWEPTTLVNHSEDLLRVDSTLTMPASKPDEKPSMIRSRMWTNRDGQVLKTAIAALHQETFRTTREFAMSAGSSRRLDLVVDHNVPLGRSLPNAHQTRRVLYRVRLEADDPAQAFFTGRLQQVASLDAHTAEITVRQHEPPAPSPSATAAGPADNPTVDAAPAGAATNPQVAIVKSRRPPTDDDRQPNNLIQSDDPAVVEMAQAVAPEETDHAKLAVALEKHVKQSITMKNFSQAFSTAAEVAKRREGDCTEHAVLLAGLARARGIPARVAIGLIYKESTQSFVYHMWNELWIDGYWVPMDATLGQGGIGAAHLKLTDSSLASASAYSSFLPVAQVIGQLKIEVLEVE